MRIFHCLAVAAVAAVASIPQMTSAAERVCRETCVAGVCKERCVETEGRGGRRFEGREREDRIEIRRERRPGIELRAPGVDVEVR